MLSVNHSWNVAVFTLLPIMGTSVPFPTTRLPVTPCGAFTVTVIRPPAMTHEELKGPYFVLKSPFHPFQPKTIHNRVDDEGLIA